MLVVFILFVAVIGGIGWFLHWRRERRIRRYEQRNHEHYLRTKRDSTVRGWFRIKRTPRLTYRPPETEGSDVSNG